LGTSLLHRRVGRVAQRIGRRRQVFFEQHDRTLQVRTLCDSDTAAAALAVDLFETDNLAHRDSLARIITDPCIITTTLRRQADDVLDFVPPCGYQNRACLRAPR
jgi:hypothetical protein